MNAAPDDLRQAIGLATGTEIASSARLRGGDVAESYRFETHGGVTLFAKTHRSPPPGFFTTEAAGLEWLRDADAIPVPDVIAVSDGDRDADGDGVGGGAEPAFLALEWVAEGRPVATTETSLGRAMARLHQAGASTFGRTDRRTTGSRALPNDPCDSWVEFFVARRLAPLVDLAADGRALSSQTLALIETVIARLGELAGPPESPARLHGDLWAGNRLVDTEGRSWLIDPACFGGHREFDLAMMRLFGGFGSACFQAYDDEFPLAAGWEHRVPLWQLTPLIVHAIKFGGGYAEATHRAATAALST